ncbi:unnamed protein product [marine sediment metagenome]|uniref:Uncharacterized protein n=1 Tax=marine sediment metagenome TaxID=412755 RepID=X0ZM83_9ZZZZ
MEKILIATVQHKHGTNFYAAKSLSGLTKQLAKYTRDWWDKECFDIQMPKSEIDQVDTYFINVDSESLELSGHIEIYD